MDRPFSLTFVCTGNRFRSPLAEAFLRRLTLGVPVQLGTAGTLEIIGAPVLAEARELGASCGVDLSSHRSRPLRAASLETVDLLLGFERDHVRRAIIDAGAAPERCFTLREFVDLLSKIDPALGVDPVGRAREAVARADELRRVESSLDGAAADIPDPFGRSWRLYRDTAAEIRELSVALAEGLFGVSDAGGLAPLPVYAEPRRRFRRFITCFRLRRRLKSSEDGAPDER